MPTKLQKKSRLPKHPWEILSTRTRNALIAAIGLRDDNEIGEVGKVNLPKTLSTLKRGCIKDSMFLVKLPGIGVKGRKEIDSWLRDHCNFEADQLWL